MAGAASAQNSLQPPSRPTSPPLPSSAASGQGRSSHSVLQRAHGNFSNAGSGSDSEGVGGAGSGGEMSDGARQRIRLKFKSSKQQSPNGSPRGSRAHSPDAPNPTTAGDPNAPPSRNGPSPPITRTSSPPFPTAADVRAHIPTTGIKMGELLTHFRGQIVGEERKSRFTQLMRENSRYSREEKKLFPLDQK